MNVLMWIAIILAVIIVIAGKYLKKIKSFASNSPYRTKNRVMNDSEQAMYINLQKQLGDLFVVLSKVRIEDFVEVKQNGLEKNERWGFRGKIKSRHVDFLICDKATTKPLLAIELDGHSHKNYGRVKRDDFVNNLYKEIGLRIEHVSVGSNFEQESIRLKNILTTEEFKEGRK
jgi:hypothetical protein